MRRVFLWRTFVLALVCFGSVSFSAPVDAQSALCGVVDALDYPLDISDTIKNRYDDFGLYRQRFGGLHTGLDLAFNRHYDPVMASARGRVTYADPEGWDTEKGVVIVQHVFPDGGVYYTLYGHMEETDEVHFPAVGTCVERGDVIGTVGWPSRGAPHLHYEIRNFLPDDGGPGYVTENPMLDGWYDPLDFTELWRLRLASGFVSAYTFMNAPTLPPVFLDERSAVIASDNVITAFTSDGSRLWGISTDGAVSSLIGLADGSILAHTRGGQALVLRGGRYAALWNVAGPDAPALVLGGAALFVTENGGVAAYDLTGTSLWTLPGDSSFTGVIDFQAGGSEAALAVRTTGGVRWRVVRADGTLSYETTFSGSPLVAPVGGGWLVLDGRTLYRVAAGERQTVGRIGITPGRTARLTADALGNAYLYAGDWESTLISLGADGQTRWETTYPSGLAVVAPVLRTDNGCLLYTLDERGLLHVFSAATGDLLNERQVYAGGVRNGSPSARLLQPLGSDVLVSGGFISTVIFDGAALGGDTFSSCLLG